MTANNVYLNATSFWGMLVEVVSGAGIPWAAIFGNHDDQPLDYPGSTSVFGVPRGTPAQTTRSDLLGYDKSFSLSRSLAMFNSSSGGKGIGYLLVGKSPENPEPAAVIWLMDTGGGSLQQVLEKVRLSPPLLRHVDPPSSIASCYPVPTKASPPAAKDRTRWIG